MNLLEHRERVLADLNFTTRTELEIELKNNEEKYNELEEKWKENNKLWEDELFNAGFMCATYRIALNKKPKIENKELSLSKDNIQYCFF